MLTEADGRRDDTRLRGRRWKRAALAGLLVATLVTETQAMAKQCLFSAVEGLVLDHGQPVVGATIERTWFWHWKDVKDGDRTSTGADGGFRLPAIHGSSLFGSLLPHEPVIEQKILIQHAGKTYRAWVFAKGDYDENTELGGKPLKLTCRLENEATRRDGVFGICTWD